MRLKNLITQDVIEKYQRGEITQREIAVMYGKKQHMTVCNYFKKMGIQPARFSGPSKNFTIRKQINFLRGCGNTQSTIARALGLSRQRISQIVREH